MKVYSSRFIIPIGLCLAIPVVLTNSFGTALADSDCWQIVPCFFFERDCRTCVEPGINFPCSIQVDANWDADVAVQASEGFDSYTALGEEIVCYEWGYCPINSSIICSDDPVKYQCVSPIFWFQENTKQTVNGVGEPDCES